MGLPVLLADVSDSADGVFQVVDYYVRCWSHLIMVTSHYVHQAIELIIDISQHVHHSHLQLLHFVLHHSAACLQSLKPIFSGRHGLDRYVWSRNLLPFSDLRRVVVMCL